MSLILVADAHPTDRSLLCSLLLDAGHQVLQATNGCGAASLAHDELPDVVILAVDLPLLDGPAAARLLKGSPTTREIPIFAITTGQSASGASRAREAGCDEVLSTPLDEDDLFERIRARLDARPAAFVNGLNRRRQLGTGSVTPATHTTGSSPSPWEARAHTAEQALATAQQRLAEAEQREAELKERLSALDEADASSPRVMQLQVSLERAERRNSQLQRAFALLQGSVRSAVDQAYQEILFGIGAEEGLSERIPQAPPRTP